jgi:hypothetical protein
MGGTPMHRSTRVNEASGAENLQPDGCIIRFPELVCITRPAYFETHLSVASASLF